MPLFELTKHEIQCLRKLIDRLDGDEVIEQETKKPALSKKEQSLENWRNILRKK